MLVIMIPMITELLETKLRASACYNSTTKRDELYFVIFKV